MEDNKIEHESVNDHLDNVMQFYAMDFLIQIGKEFEDCGVCNIEKIMNDHDLSVRFNCYLIKQLSGYLPVIVNEN